jgi:hypothetical protein
MAPAAIAGAPWPWSGAVKTPARANVAAADCTAAHPIFMGAPPSGGISQILVVCTTISRQTSYSDDQNPPCQANSQEEFTHETVERWRARRALRVVNWNNSAG